MGSIGFWGSVEALVCVLECLAALLTLGLTTMHFKC